MTDNELLLAISELLDKKLDSRIKPIENRLEKIEDRIEKIEDQIEKIENKVTNIELILENEIRVNIKRVAEGHLDLSRNLHEVMKRNNEIEMLAIKVSMLESEVRTLKQKIS